MSTQHTPTLVALQAKADASLRDMLGTPIAQFRAYGRHSSQEMAEAVARCVNSHDALVEALRALLEMNNSDNRNTARAALKAATEQA